MNSYAIERLLGKHNSGARKLSRSTKNFRSEIFGWFLGFEFFTDGSEKAWLFLRPFDHDSKSGKRSALISTLCAMRPKPIKRDVPYQLTTLE